MFSTYYLYFLSNPPPPTIPSLILLYVTTQKIDMERLADGLQRLHEDDLLEVIKIVHENKTSETYTKNDPECKS